MPKPPSKTAAKTVTQAQANALARDLADKPYGGSKSDDRAVSISISLPRSMAERLQDKAIENKRAGLDDKTVSAILRTVLENAGY